MPDYVQRFVINRKTYHVQELADGSFLPRYAGYSIHLPVKTMVEAREILHRYAVSQSRAEIASAEAMMKAALGALALLGDDPFNLGRFRT